jgi:hypothetical protein
MRGGLDHYLRHRLAPDQVEIGPCAASDQTTLTNINTVDMWMLTPSASPLNIAKHRKPLNTAHDGAHKIAGGANP